jgi:hypothetical protein
LILGAIGPVGAVLFGASLPEILAVAWLSSIVVWAVCAAAALAYLVSRSATQKVVANNESNRVKQSRHEWLQERSLERIERLSRAAATGVSGLTWAAFRGMESGDAASGPGAPPRVLFVTSNGGGMGHIARCAAVLRSSDGVLTGRILTLSTAAPTVAAAGYDVEYFPSQTTTDVDPERWRRQFTRRLLDEVAVYRPAAIVFDGTWVYPSLTDVAEFVDLPLVWLRRGLWRAGTGLEQVERWRDHVTSVIVPSDIAETRANASEMFQDATWVDPVSLAPDSPMTREKALTALGLDRGSRYALIQLSGGNDDGSATGAAVRAVRDTSEIVPVVAKSPLLSSAATHDAVTIDARFPLVDVAAAWEFTVTGAGYNSVHENLHTGTPGLYLPSSATLTDDQHKRASVMAERGLGISATDVDDLPRRIREIARGDTRSAMKYEMDRTRVPNGASVVASAVVQDISG